MKVLIAGGGTGGHINPGLSIAKHIKRRQPASEIIFVGTHRGLETKLVPREGFELRLIRVKGFRRKLSLDTLVSVKELIQGFAEARKIIKQFRPEVVIGTGGYVCGPVVLNAALSGIPTLIHEQNVFPGVTNRLLSRFVNSVAVSFKESEQYLKGARKLVHTGNPVRDEILKANRTEARSRLDIDGSKPLVVVVGGSLGAERINLVTAELIKKYSGQMDFNLIFATGNSQYEAVRELLKGLRHPLITITPYIYNAGEVYAAADLIVCRAGAITCSELTVIGLPSIMIPSPNVTANHQEYNARSLEKNGASVVILEKELNADILYRQLNRLIKDREQLDRMARSAKKTGITNAVEKIYSLIMELVEI